MNISSEAFLIESKSSAEELKAKIYPYRKQEKIKNQWLMERFETVLPKVMMRSGIDFWVVACKEYNEDPVFTSLVPCAMMTARRTTILAFYLKEDGSVQRMALTRPGVGLDDYYEAVWTNPKGSNWKDNKAILNAKAGEMHSVPETQFECLARIIKEKNPQKIAFNYSDTFAFADGISHSLYQMMVAELDVEYQSRIVSGEKVCLGWLETRSENEMAAYSGIMQIAHTIIAEAFSSRVVIPGVTMSDDVKYYLLQRVIDLGLRPWFNFEVSIRRAITGAIYDNTLILPGDILHCDFGLEYLGLLTDTQENAYVLRLDETDVPQDLKDAMKMCNRLQDIVISHFKEGRTGNEVLKAAREQAIKEGIRPCIYTHPIGKHGHGAGPTIGLFDMQQGVPVQGDYPLYNDTAYSLELNCTVTIPIWDNTEFAFGAETDILFTKDHVHFLAGRQENYHLIK